MSACGIACALGGWIGSCDNCETMTHCEKHSPEDAHMHTSTCPRCGHDTEFHVGMFDDPHACAPEACEACGWLFEEDYVSPEEQEELDANKGGADEYQG